MAKENLKKPKVPNDKERLLAALKVFADEGAKHKLDTDIEPIAHFHLKKAYQVYTEING